jgi:hypothetical protein
VGRDLVVSEGMRWRLELLVAASTACVGRHQEPEWADAVLWLGNSGYALCEACRVDLAFLLHSRVRPRPG